MKMPPREQQLPLPIVEEIRTRRGNVLYFGDDYRRLLRQVNQQRRKESRV